MRVIGYEIDDDKVKKLNNSKLNQENNNLFITNDPMKIRDADFVIISVPTPVTRSQELDLGYVESASETISENLKRGSVVILESTVYPGVTEEIIKPILEESGLRCGMDFKVAYSPERINPGDDVRAAEDHKDRERNG
ncbi:MAG: UDP-N-acetyl-D-mannosamine dehydrogenase [Candidatus Argoarchaeum ethanivorans]|uniref:UDP-N-acetyl-D-mannosamine dehydrogenase n=1 Tax=Candidatus Argoarchaeum ethanivorans TaxID=2608793 RepID=A0A811TAT1_9EURY|nr:MAG: UDP-N-acetyl-D-mannosamine dehydrogenase [Candidatus Argoarchaeum ethanivorans]CAD6491667.1 MAG: UDP-N-acetyl-D-mannosamine dehydrogenase [Candidatus Argoarchaeum ethanivorans]CAD6493518.1 MAG: UDP-N-acetyl-D-mannosamine dehydrogenase [Candidatus Argoarchaeum ethanivorans]